MGTGLDGVIGRAVGKAVPRVDARAGRVAEGVGSAARREGIAGLDGATARFADLAGKVEAKRGTWTLPEVDDEVLIAFRHGGFRRPIVVGSLWNGKDAPPTGGSSGKDAPSWEGKAAKLADSGAGAHPTLRRALGKVRAMAETIGGIRDLARHVESRRS
jgi:hypothetical protein